MHDVGHRCMTPQRAVAIVRLSVPLHVFVYEPPRKTRVVRKDASFSLTMIFGDNLKYPGIRMSYIFCSPKTFC